jgi:(p)ppGpp synthase/HD superfamily hydrolase
VFSERFEEALVFAHQLHRRQIRKTSGVPYVAHVLGVAALVIEDGGSEDETVAALLHDSLEDQSRHYPGGAPKLANDIEARFGAEVRRIVDACTERTTEEEAGIRDKRERWRAHKRGYFAQIRKGGASVRRVSCADSLHNVRTLLLDYREKGESIWSSFLTRNGEDQVWGYRSAAEAFLRDGVGRMAEELMRSVEELARIMSE